MKLPEGYTHADPVPLVLSFHGWRGTALGQKQKDRLDEVADDETFAVAWADGYGDHHSGEGSWNSWNAVGSSRSPGIEGPTCTVNEDFCYASCEARPQRCDRCDWTTCVNDVGFVEGLLHALEATYCLDLNRLYATGFSNGGMFSWQVGQSLGHLFAAVAPGGGQPFVGFVQPPNLTGGHRIPLLDFHGEGDIVCPPYGGESGGSSDTGGWIYAAVSHGTRVWAEAHGCNGRDTVFRTPYDDYVTCYKHGECADGAEFVRCLWDGGHVWPQLPSEVEGSRLVWWFFTQHPFIPPQGPPANRSQLYRSRSTPARLDWTAYRNAALVNSANRTAAVLSGRAALS